MAFFNYCHNPYFNRWFSAIIKNESDAETALKVTILILIDGFLQYRVRSNFIIKNKMSQSLF